MFKLIKPATGIRQSSLLLPFSYEIVRSPRRRSISIEVRAAEVVVRAPMRVPERELHDFVREKSRWIVQKIAAQQQHIDSLPRRTYSAGSVFPYLGRTLTLSLVMAASASVELIDDCLRVGLSSRSRLAPEEQARRLIYVWYQQQALSILSARTSALTLQMGLRCSAVTIRATRSKWGHCTSRGAIQYNWQIILAPEAIVDYLVAHEVCHLRHPNHSSAFWQLVASVCPTYEKDRAWLKARGAHLVL